MKLKKVESLKVENTIENTMEEKEFKFKEGVDYYLDKNQIILTESYLVRRGKCCGSGCLFCPYEPFHTKGSTKLRDKPKC